MNTKNYFLSHKNLSELTHKFTLIVGEEVFSFFCCLDSLKRAEIKDEELIELRDFLNRCFPLKPGVEE